MAYRILRQHIRIWGVFTFFFRHVQAHDARAASGTAYRQGNHEQMQKYQLFWRAYDLSVFRAACHALATSISASTDDGHRMVPKYDQERSLSV